MRPRNRLPLRSTTLHLLAGLASCSTASVAEAPLADVEWPTFGGDPGRTQYSPLHQIDRENVHRLQVAWTYRTGDARPDGRSQIQCNPVVVEAILYCTSPQLKAFAVEAATGRELWVFDPFADGAVEQSSLGVNRGVVYWQDEGGADRRILMTAGHRLFALDARTGTPVAGFGDNGSIDIREGLGRPAEELFVLSNTPGAVYRDLLILGTRVGEGPGPSAPGHIRAYDIRTGEIRWRFNTIPHPGEYGYDTWPPDAWTRAGGANAWSGITVDLSRGLVFLPTGSAAFDFWGGNRHGENLFANTLLVLDAGTGERVWHYQVVRHDLWDRDLPAAPVLVTVTRNGRRVDAVAQATKTGHLFLFDRGSGEPLFPVEEVAAPPSDLRGEQAWPTQPIPVRPPPFARQVFTRDVVTDISPEARAAVLARLEGLRDGHTWMPPSTQGTVIFPGFDGGAEWGGSAWDPATGLLYVNSNEMPWILTMVPLPRDREVTPGALGRHAFALNCAVCHGPDLRGDPAGVNPALHDIALRRSRAEADEIIAHGRGTMPGFPALNAETRAAIVAYLFGDAPPPDPAGRQPEADILYTHTGYNRFLDPEGYPAVKPPWGTLSAIDLNAGEIVWQVPLGEFPELTRRGIPRTGTENYGGPVVTAGGLVFIAATRDEKFRAFDKRTGEILWEVSLPAGGYATPSTYSVGGRQYVVIAAGGGKMGTRSGDAYMAFALPGGE